MRDTERPGLKRHLDIDEARPRTVKRSFTFKRTCVECVCLGCGCFRLLRLKQEQVQEREAAIEGFREAHKTCWVSQ
jgi:hypothetical protein